MITPGECASSRTNARRGPARRWPGGRGVGRRRTFGTVSGIMPGSGGGAWPGPAGAGACVSVRFLIWAVVIAQMARGGHDQDGVLGDRGVERGAAGPGDVTMHTDQGSEYTAQVPAGLRPAGPPPVHGPAGLGAGVAAWVEDYNRDRRHSALGMRSRWSASWPWPRLRRAGCGAAPPVSRVLRIALARDGL